MIMTTLDAEILDATEGDDIESEIEQADIIREAIDTAILEIQAALSDLNSPHCLVPRPRFPTAADGLHRRCFHVAVM